jgi:hypothetical protein
MVPHAVFARKYSTHAAPVFPFAPTTTTVSASSNTDADARVVVVVVGRALRRTAPRRANERDACRPTTVVVVDIHGIV